jgi:hypothetical protein
MKRWQALGAVEAFALVVLKFRTQFVDLITDGTYGARMIAGAVIAGVVVSIVAALKATASSSEASLTK